MNVDQKNIDEAAGLTAAISQLLSWRSPDVQGMVLADLTATWLCGFVGPDHEAARETVLELHITQVRRLIPVNEILNAVAEASDANLS